MSIQVISHARLGKADVHLQLHTILEEVQTRLQLLSVEQLEQLLDVALTVTTMPDFVARLPKAVQTEAAGA